MPETTSSDPLPQADTRSIVGGGEGWDDMHARVGDRIVTESNKVDSPRREGEIIEVRGADGAPPYVVRWSDGHEGLTYPGPDTHVVAR